MKIAVLAGVTFAVTLGGSSVFVMMTAPADEPAHEEPTAMPAESVPQDSAPPATGPDTTAAPLDAAPTVAHEPEPEPEPHADSATTESATAAPTPAEPVISAGSPDTQVAQDTAAPTAPVPVPVPLPPPTPQPAPVDTTPDEGESARQLARIFSAMRPAEAASVLTHMEDDEVVTILRFLTPRKAAGLLGGLPEARAAVISRKLMRACPDCGGGE